MQRIKLKKGNEHPRWILDSGANKHMIGDKSLLHNYHSNYKSQVKVENGTYIFFIGYETIRISNSRECIIYS